MRIFLSSALLLCLLLGSTAWAAEKPTLGMRYPSLTPDNQQVVFGYRGDIWIAPVDGSHPAARLTIHEAEDSLPRVSPDGKRIAFTSTRGGGYDIFLLDIEGGVPTQLTFHSADEIMCDWSPDGSRILFLSSRDPGLYRHDLYEVAVSGGTPRRVTTDGGREGSYGADNKAVYYVRGFNSIYQDNYEGAANYDIYRVAGPGALPERLTDTEGNERYPFLAADGKTVYFVAEEDGVANFYARAEDGTVRRLTDLKDDVWRPDLSWDGKTTVFELAGRLYTADLSAEKVTPKEIALVVKSDVRHSGIEIRTVTSGAEQVDVSNDGRQLAFTVHGDLWLMPTSGGEARRLGEGGPKGAREWPRFSPDGTQVAYQVNADGNSDIYVVDVKSGRSAKLVATADDEFFHDWSPDGRRLVFARQKGQNRDIWVANLESGEEKRLTTHNAADDDPAFSADGRWIAFDSGRSGTNHAIYVMPADGGEPRQLTNGSSFAQVPSWSPDGRLIAYEVFNPAGGGSGGIFVVSVEGGPSMQVSRDGSTARWSPRGDHIYFAATRDGKKDIFRVHAPTAVEAGERVPFLARVEIDQRRELADLFDEAWSRMKNAFYDSKMHGVDWDAMKAKYRDMAIDAENKDVFQSVIRQMLAELGASHMGISGGHRPSNMARSRTDQTGWLGLEFDPELADDGGRKVSSVIPGGPGDQAGIRDGDVLTRVGRTRLEASTNLDQLLGGTVGKDVEITFRPITADGLGDERKVTVKPISLRSARQLHYRRWVERSRRIVREEGGRGIGYIHLNAMDRGNLNRFRQQVGQWIQNDRTKGMIIDVRENGGGNIHDELMQVLMARPYIKLGGRNGRKLPEPRLYWDRPVVVLANERSYSDAEVFPHSFQAAGLGKVVGAPTAGAVIGFQPGMTLSDGSSFQIPSLGWWSLDGKRLEGMGVQPDILIEETAEDRREGRDPQLLEAIRVLKAEIRDERTGGAETPQPERPRPETPGAETPGAETPGPETPRPATPRPVGEASEAFPLADATVGEWVRYRVTLGGNETVVRLEVVEVTDDEVRFVKDVEEGGAFLPPLPDEAPRRPVLEALEAMGSVQGSDRSSGTLDDQEVAFLNADVVWGETPARLVFTNAVPGLGLYRIEVNGTLLMEAVDWSDRGMPPVAEAAPEHAPVPPDSPVPVPDEPAPRPEGDEGEAAPDAGTAPFMLLRGARQ